MGSPSAAQIERCGLLSRRPTCAAEQRVTLTHEPPRPAVCGLAGIMAASCPPCPQQPTLPHRLMPRRPAAAVGDHRGSGETPTPHRLRGDQRRGRWSSCAFLPAPTSTSRSAPCAVAHSPGAPDARTAGRPALPEAAEKWLPHLSAALDRAQWEQDQAGPRARIPADGRLKTKRRAGHDGCSPARVSRAMAAMRRTSPDTWSECQLTWP
jgi:hypothetical protein